MKSSLRIAAAVLVCALCLKADMNPDGKIWHPGFDISSNRSPITDIMLYHVSMTIPTSPMLSIVGLCNLNNTISNGREATFGAGLNIYSAWNESGATENPDGKTGAVIITPRWMYYKDGSSKELTYGGGIQYVSGPYVTMGVVYMYSKLTYSRYYYAGIYSYYMPVTMKSQTINLIPRFHLRNGKAVNPDGAAGAVTIEPTMGVGFDTDVEAFLLGAGALMPINSALSLYTAFLASRPIDGNNTSKGISFGARIYL